MPKIFVSCNEASYFTQQEILQQKKLNFLGTEATKSTTVKICRR